MTSRFVDTYAFPDLSAKNVGIVKALRSSDDKQLAGGVKYVGGLLDESTKKQSHVFAIGTGEWEAHWGELKKRVKEYRAVGKRKLAALQGRRNGKSFAESQREAGRANLRDQKLAAAEHRRAEAELEKLLARFKQSQQNLFLALKQEFQAAVKNEPAQDSLQIAIDGAAECRMTLERFVKEGAPVIDNSLESLSRLKTEVLAQLAACRQRFAQAQTNAASPSARQKEINAALLALNEAELKAMEILQRYQALLHAATRKAAAAEGGKATDATLEELRSFLEEVQGTQRAMMVSLRETQHETSSSEDETPWGEDGNKLSDEQLQREILVIIQKIRGTQGALKAMRRGEVPPNQRFVLRMFNCENDSYKWDGSLEEMPSREVSNTLKKEEPLKTFCVFLRTKEEVPFATLIEEGAEEIAKLGFLTWRRPAMFAFSYYQKDTERMWQIVLRRRIFCLGTDFKVMAGKRYVGEIDGKILRWGTDSQVRVIDPELENDEAFMHILCLFAASIGFHKQINKSIKRQTHEAAHHGFITMNRECPELGLLKHSRREAQ